MTSVSVFSENDEKFCSKIIYKEYIGGCLLILVSGIYGYIVLVILILIISSTFILYLCVWFDLMTLINYIDWIDMQDPGVIGYFCSNHLATNSISHLRPSSKSVSPAREDPVDPVPNIQKQIKAGPHLVPWIPVLCHWGDAHAYSC